MFTLAQPAYYPTYNPYEELLLQQELERRRQVEAYLHRQREAEELERRRQYEYAIRQAELERRRQAEYERRRAEVEGRRQEVELQRRHNIERHRHSMFDAGVQDLFDMIYGGDARPRSMSMSARATPTREQPEGSQRNAASSDEKPSTQTRSTPTPAPAPEPSFSPADQELEDETPQIDTTPSLAAVQSILASFATLQSEFIFPTQIDFLPSSSESSPKLAYTPNNAPLHGYEHALTGLLTQLDAVESFGDDEVRRTRKEAVKTVEKELEGLDAGKAEMWMKQSESEVLASREVESTEAEAEVATEVDPHAVPIPHDSDVEDEGEDEGEEMSEAAPEVSPSLERADTTTSTPAAESPLPTPKAFSTSIQLPLVEDLPPLPDSPITVVSTIAPSLATLIPIVIPSASDAEPLSRSLDSPSPSESSDTNSDMELEEYVDVTLISASEPEGEDEDTEVEEVEKEEDLEIVHDWDLGF